MLPAGEIEVAQGDVTDLASVRAATSGCEGVIHAAAHLAYSPADRQEQWQVNVGGTRNVVESCLGGGVRKLVHVSSISAIGYPADPSRPADESHPFNFADPRLPYHLSKRAAEEEVLRGVGKGLDAVIVNPASIFGPFGTAYRGSGWLSQVRERRLVAHFRGGICVVHVEDVAEGVTSAMAQGRRGKRYILGGDNLGYRELARRTADALGVTRRYLAIPGLVTGITARWSELWSRLSGGRPRLGYAVHFCANRFQFYDWSRARQELEYRPRGFEAILREWLRRDVDSMWAWRDTGRSEGPVGGDAEAPSDGVCADHEPKHESCDR